MSKNALRYEQGYLGFSEKELNMKKQDSDGGENGTDFSDSDDFAGVVGSYFPYISRAFTAGIERRKLLSLSVQLLSDGTYKGLIRAVKGVGTKSEAGYIAFVSGESYGHVLGSLELGIAYDDLDWRKDNYYKRTAESTAKRRQGKMKVNLD